MHSSLFFATIFLGQNFPPQDDICFSHMTNGTRFKSYLPYFSRATSPSVAGNTHTVGGPGMGDALAGDLRNLNNPPPGRGIRRRWRRLGVAWQVGLAGCPCIGIIPLIPLHRLPARTPPPSASGVGYVLPAG